MAATKTPCTICGGSIEEHQGSRHAYTTTPGDLKVPETPKPNQSPRLNGAQTNEAQAIGRLLEILAQKNILSLQEAIYVAGMGPKPEGD